MPEELAEGKAILPHCGDSSLSCQSDCAACDAKGDTEDREGHLTLILATGDAMVPNCGHCDRRVVIGADESLQVAVC